jgi:predicted metal-dependent HD superfamily phosphohydrolase
MRDTWARKPERRGAAGLEWWHRLATAYAEPHRRYHTMDHLASMFAEAEPFHPLPPALEWAIWFHDFVYDPRRPGNEEESARTAQPALMEMNEQPPVIQRTADLILATRHGPAAVDGDDAQLLISLDLRILAEPPHTYDAYVAKIREEFAHVPDSQFRAGRAAFMRRFLERSAIFPHPGFRRFERAARANILRELNRLGSA